MAGDWIKMRSNLWDDPRVSRLCDLTDQGEATVIGGLYWLWAAADQHTETGVMTGLSLRQIDRKTGIAGFGQSLCDIGWIAECEGGVCIVNFEEHNGASAKRRTLEAKRKADARKTSAPNADKGRTETGQDAELEKEREKEKEKKKNKPSTPAKRRRTYTPEFEEFWSAYPKKSGKGDAQDAWTKINPNAELKAKILWSLEAQKRSHDWTKENGKYIPNPSTWLNQDRWEDELPPAEQGAVGGFKKAPDNPYGDF
ncbi:hypothetical protein [Spongiibacter tropicus]|uniref:hypothetical protein n=1 Tax=Spongiibacter tropicus TaxID=454602 RepID=UPI002351FE6C|nr:hypothetical protein [Spongiibacter tropicus]|tara:strand:- start:3953 stop:4717 length:765 start_codon:yes stop_codon:yes gene_type:complete